MVDHTFQFMKRFRHRPESVLDLCCGTGSAVCLFAERGLGATGLDRSKEMLKIAHARAKEKDRLRIRPMLCPDLLRASFERSGNCTSLHAPRKYISEAV